MMHIQRYMGYALVALLGLAVAGCSDEFPTFPDAGSPPDAAAGDSEVGDGEVAVGSWTASLTVSPADAHPGEVLTLTFMIMRDDAPVDGLAPTAHFEQSVGGTATGEIALSAGMAPGTYVGSRGFIAAGTYLLHLEFDDAGAPVSVMVPPLVLESH